MFDKGKGGNAQKSETYYLIYFMPTVIQKNGKCNVVMVMYIDEGTNKHFKIENNEVFLPFRILRNLCPLP
jgi:hypothetical protein